MPDPVVPDLRNRTACVQSLQLLSYIICRFSDMVSWMLDLKLCSCAVMQLCSLAVMQSCSHSISYEVSPFSILHPPYSSLISHFSFIFHFLVPCPQSLVPFFSLLSLLHSNQQSRQYRIYDSPVQGNSFWPLPSA
jgi:hypothetical protein